MLLFTSVNFSSVSTLVSVATSTIHPQISQGDISLYHILFLFGYASITFCSLIFKDTLQKFIYFIFLSWGSKQQAISHCRFTAEGARTNPGTQNSFCVSHWVTGTQLLELPSPWDNISRKPESGGEPGLKPSHFHMGCECPKWLLKCYTTCLPPILNFLNKAVRYISLYYQ